MKKNLILVITTLIFAFIVYYFMLPPINLHSMLFWLFMLIVAIFSLLINFILLGYDLSKNFHGSLGTIKDTGKYSAFVGISIFICTILIVIINLFTSPLFNSKKYASMITVNEENEFVKDVSEADFSKMPLLDKESSQKLGDRKMGEMTEWVSQFSVSDLYTQINYNDKIVRVTPLEYDGLIKYFTNRHEGVKGYITVNSVDGSSNLVQLDKGMKYMPSAYFNEDLMRTLRFKFPTLIFDKESFEIDNSGNPYWIVPIIKYAGISMRKDIQGVVILNAITGETKKYDVNDVPSWIDHVYPADLIVNQVDDWGNYRGGFWNSIFGQKNVVKTTDGYNYLILGDDVYLYTGITSVAADESNLGFVLVNLRTKQTNFYSAAGAEEYSAMSSAEGLVQEKKYKASFPLLINLNNRPTYLISLKDNAGLVKMYAFVDVVDYQIVSTTDASLGINYAVKNYMAKINKEDTTNTEVQKDTIIIKNITSAIIDGDTNYFITDTNDVKYQVSIKVNQYLIPFLNKNDSVNITYNKKTINIIKSIEVK
jgi:hypothetical protein